MEKPNAYVYPNLNEVPQAWRKLRGARLSVEQVNEITQRAYELGSFASDAEGKPASFVVDYGNARQQFIEANTVANGLWVTKKEGAK